MDIKDQIAADAKLIERWPQRKRDLYARALAAVHANPGITFPPPPEQTND